MSKILLVEDNPDAVKRIIRYINKIFAELDVVSFPEAGDALQYAKANDILALYCKNIFVILTGPFMYSILENFVLAILCLERLRLVVAFDPTTVNPEVVSIFSFFFGPIVLSIVIGLTAFLLSKKNAVVTI